MNDMNDISTAKDQLDQTIDGIYIAGRKIAIDIARDD